MTQATDPADDAVATIRVHPLDDPHSPTARRYLLTDDDRNHQRTVARPWTQITGNDREDRGVPDLGHEAVVGYLVQSPCDLGRIFGHRLEQHDTERSAT